MASDESRRIAGEILDAMDAAGYAVVRKSELAALRAEAEKPSEACEGFQWIGQSFASCDNCGRPRWEHKADHHPTSVFGTDYELIPITEEQADAMRRTWDPNYYSPEAKS